MIILALIFWVPVFIAAIVLSLILGLWRNRFFWVTSAVVGGFPVAYLFLVQPIDPDVVVGLTVAPLLAFILVTFLWVIALELVRTIRRASARKKV
ncbi:MAG TPA: hypothetical protein VGR25_12170 [bacterium]|jgi:hypothetical protein|nr:hypothetical protein [bacterium]